MQTVQQMITGSIRGKSSSEGTETILDKCRKFHAFYEAYMSRFNMQNPYLRTLDPASSPIVSREDRPLIQLGSNNYLGLSNHPEIKKAVKEVIDIYGTGCCSSRPLAGTTSLHIKLEEELAKFKESESSLLFSTGYMTMMGTIYALVGEQDIVFSDQLNHASIIDGIRLSKAQLKVYKHNDMTHLEENLASCDPGANKIIITDGVFSMRGDIANLPRIKELAEHYGALIMVDDAHGTGVLGENGRGILEHFRMEGDIDLVCCTFSKTFGTVGGAVAARKEVIDFLRFNSRPFIFTASLPPSVVMTVLASLGVIKKSPDLLTKLRNNTAFLKESLLRLNFRLLPTETPIIPLLIGDDEKTLRMALELEKEGVFVNPIIPPGVSVESSLIRLSVMATLSEEELEFAVEKIKLVGRRVGIIS
jgi:8-amino-7-oxononanoate synthase